MKVSFIVNGDSLNKPSLLALKDRLQSLREAGYTSVEFVLYFSGKVKLNEPRQGILFISGKGQVPVIQKAIVVASGEKLVFTTVNNLLADKKSSILEQALTAEVNGISAPLSKNILNKISRTTKTAYVLADKKFVVGFANKVTSFTGLLAHAPQAGSITEVPQVSAPFEDFIVLDQSLISPKKHLIQENTPSPRKKPVRYSQDIPTFIISRDRVEPLKKLVKWCEDEGLNNLIFIDNNSSYPPLLDYYSSLQYEVLRLGTNVGYLSPWQTGAVAVFAKNRPYIVTDSDVIPEASAHGAVELFCRLLNKYPDYIKAGFGLRIDDLPDSYEPKDYVIAWEKKFWQKKIEEDIYDADIDTTFALWRQNTTHTYGPSLRTAGKYIARHDTWYMNSKRPTEEMRYYREHADKEIGTWGAESTELPQSYIKANNKTKKART